jgi:ABC-type enterobactin transport system permease subunit
MKVLNSIEKEWKTSSNYVISMVTSKLTNANSTNATSMLKTDTELTTVHLNSHKSGVLTSMIVKLVAKMPGLVKTPDTLLVKNGIPITSITILN